MDRLDAAILGELNENARKSFRDIARALDVSIGTVSTRLKRMEEEGVVRGYVPIVDPAKLGFDVTAVIGVRIAKGKIIEVQKRIAKDPRVFQVYDVTGDWDSVVCARFRNARELDQFLKTVLSQEFIERTHTHVVLNVVKDERRVTPG